MTAARVDTRRAILDSGRRVITAKGYSAVGLNEILKEAGVPKGSFYHFFTSRDAFGEALLQRYFDEYFATMDRITADRNKNAAQQLMQYWQNFYDTQAVDDCQGRCLVVKLGAEIADLSEAMRETMKAGTTQIVDRLERMITAGVGDGSLTIDADPRATAETLYDLWLGASVMAKIHRSTACLDRCMATTRRILHN
ncbi:transcriptional regulator, TetR family [Actinacidiphila yanglinensis]|uniref:Transcriptional regulator, TetR family n=1 Tax=Actinacidiphila yanglinensis TaxID=310779 RepID=A0A1H5X942_9ACTN|nr:TetR/AcrR family transcriptional regulator [Actinacidiphila yanglinensis]SEG08163.1 transcriptional regulator, TetR family [Actinacidiphila yanglinensis]